MSGPEKESHGEGPRISPQEDSTETGRQAIEEEQKAADAEVLKMSRK